MSEGYVAQRRAKDAAKLAQRKCQRKGCDCSLPVNAIARQKFCSDQCRIKANAAVRPARDQSHRTEYHKLYQQTRRRLIAAGQWKGRDIFRLKAEEARAATEDGLAEIWDTAASAAAEFVK